MIRYIFPKFSTAPALIPNFSGAGKISVTIHLWIESVQYLASNSDFADQNPPDQVLGESQGSSDHTKKPTV